MNKSFSLKQISRTGNLDSNLISRQRKLNLMADFMRVIYEKPKMKQSEIANQLGYSSSTLQRYRNDINLFSPYRIQPNNTNKQTKNLQMLFLTTFHILTMTLKDLRRPEMTSRRPQTN